MGAENVEIWLKQTITDNDSDLIYSLLCDSGFWGAFPEIYLTA
jgi:hypothetical protein